MITAGLAPGCPTTVHRLLAWIVERRALEPLSWSPLAVTLAYAIPLALLTVVAIWSWRTQRRFLSASVLLAAYALHPPCVLPLAALYPRHASSTSSRFLSSRGGALLFAISAAVLFAATPDCAGAERPSLLEIALDSLTVLRQGVGVTLGLLALFEVFAAPQDRDVRLAGALILLGIAAIFLSPAFDRRMTLVAPVVACWWLAGRAALRLIRDPQSWAVRAATLLVLTTIPVLTLADVAITAPPRVMRTTWSGLTSTLARIPRPAALVTTDAAMFPWIAAWRAGLADGANSLATVSPDSTSFDHAMETRAVLAFDADAERLSRTGVVWVPVEPVAGHDSPRLWRAVDYMPCVPLTASWSDITSLAEMAQVTIRLSDANASAITVVYAAQPGSLAAGHSVSLTDAGPMALRGTRLREFDVDRADGRQQFAAAALADGLDTTGWLGQVGYVSRVTIDHEPATAALATLTFGAPPTRVAARAERRPRWPNALSMCRSTTPQPVAGYPDAPEEMSINLQEQTWSGRGWHSPETEAGVAFRWTGEPQAEIRVFIAHPQSYLLKLGLMPIAGNASETLVVKANGRPLARAGQSDTWHLPSGVLRRGSNTVTLNAPVVAGPPGDGRRLGLKVRSIVLHRITPE